MRNQRWLRLLAYVTGSVSQELPLKNELCPSGPGNPAHTSVNDRRSGEWSYQAYESISAYDSKSEPRNPERVRG